AERALWAARWHAAGAAGGRHPGPFRARLGKDRFLMGGYGRVTCGARSRGRLQAPVTVSDAAELRRGLARASGAGPLAAADAARLLRAPARAGRRGALTADEAAELLSRHGPLTLRHRAPGASVRLPAGSNGLADLLVDRKVPRESRDALLVLDAGDEVVWVE